MTGLSAGGSAARSGRLYKGSTICKVIQGLLSVDSVRSLDHAPSALDGAKPWLKVMKSNVMARWKASG